MVTKANPNVIPLCDILLVLLIIFMVISPMAQAGVDVRIPDRDKDDGKPVVLTIEKSGLITVGQETFTDPVLLERWLKDLYASRTDSTIFVQSHKDVLYKDVVKTIDLIKGVGVDKVCLMPQKKNNVPGPTGQSR